MPPTTEKMQEMLVVSHQLEKAKSDYKEAMDKFTRKASELNYMLLEEGDYYGYITRREPVPEWLRELPSKAWMIEPRKATREVTSKKKKDIASKMYSKLMGGFK